MKKICFSICLLLASSTAPLHAQAGSTGLAFLKLGAGARALGMGEAYTAVATDPSATYYNASALSFSRTPQILLMHKEWIQDTRTEFLAATTSFDRVAVGVSVNGTTINSIELRTVPGPAEEIFSARNAAIGFSAAYRVDSALSIGATGKYLFEKILVDEATGYGFDVGATYLTPWDIRLGLAVNNFGSMDDLRSEATRLPQTYRFGASYQCRLERLDAVFTGAADLISYSNENISHGLFGGEFDYKHTFAIRLGYQTSYESKSFSAGVGIRYEIFRIDYAFVPFKYELGSAHTFSLNIEFL